MRCAGRDGAAARGRGSIARDFGFVDNRQLMSCQNSVIRSWAGPRRRRDNLGRRDNLDGTGARGPGPEAERISERLWPVTGINLIMGAGPLSHEFEMAGEKPI